jgi:hypothetical protein
MFFYKKHHKTSINRSKTKNHMNKKNLNRLDLPFHVFIEKHYHYQTLLVEYNMLILKIDYFDCQNVVNGIFSFSFTIFNDFLFTLLDPVCLMEITFLWKVVFYKVNYFLMFGSVMKNKLENIFQCLVMS